jgi:membrane-associated PAP2 superfamily phosphatase
MGVTLLLWFITLLFWIFPWDMAVANFWYDQGWPSQKDAIWQLFYQGVPIVSGIILVGSLLVLIGSLWVNRLHALRKPISVLFVTMVLGPGLLVNGVFKDHWGRPRPRQVEEFGGSMHYLPPFKPAFGQNGLSLPCGHCSVPFAFYALSLVSSTPLGKVSWAIVATVMGGGTGAARIAAGGHFLSDVILSAWFSFLAAWMSARWLPCARFRIHRNYLTFGGVALVTFAGAGALLATPLDKEMQFRWDENTPQTIHIDEGTIWLHVSDADHSELTVHLSGFGWPGSTVVSHDADGAVVFDRKGVFTEFEAVYQLNVPKGLAAPLDIQTQHGIFILPEAGAAAQVTFHLTKAGHLVVTPKPRN